MAPNPLFKDHLINTKKTYIPGKTRAEVDAGQTVYKLSSNENLLGTSPLAGEAIREAVGLLHEYPEGMGQSLMVALSEFYQGQLSPDQFTIGNSATGIFEQFIPAFLGPGLNCMVSSPTFGPSITFSKKFGAEVRDIPLNPGDYSIDVPGILDAIDSQTRVIWLASPNNPTGTYIPKAQVDELIYELPEHVLVVFDEVYHPYATATDFVRALPYVLEGRNVMGINSFSKTYGLAGLRIGYAYSTKEIMHYLNDIRRPFLVNQLAIEAAKAALQDKEFVRRSLQMVEDGKQYLYPKLQELGVKYWPSQTNFILFESPVSEVEFEAEMLKHGVMVRAVGSFGAHGCIRVTIGTPEANRAFVKGLEQVVKS